MAIDRNPPEVLKNQLLRDIAKQGGFKRYAASTIIISEGEAADSLYIILTGRVKVYSSNDAGKEVTIVTYGPGEYVGELALDGGARSASVKTLEPTTCSVVSGSNLREFIAAHPDFGLHLIHKLIWRLRQATGSVKSLALQDVYGRIIRLLDELSVLQQGSERAVTERLTQQDIADRVGSSREMVSRIFKDLNNGGYVSVTSGRIRILKQPPSAW
jgi:CRP/FNR family cyclic AMP-dependent transcriptional regulator